MKSQATLLLVCMLVSEALALNCLQCVPQIQGPCPSQGTTCPDQCLTLTSSVQTGAVMTNTSVMTCGSPEMCANGSLNLGFIKIASNAKCCSTDLCNTETLPAPSEQDPNGRKCQVCNASDCTGTVNCTGSEDRCITASVIQGSNAVLVKGCVSNSLCIASELSNTTFGITKVKCCEGNLCNAGTGGPSDNGTVGDTGGSSGNDAESFTLSFLLMIVPLLSFILFH